MSTLHEYLKHNTLLFDGGMGVYYQEKHPDRGRCEEANLIHPGWVLEIHREYIAAGAQAIKTNTFAASTQAMLTSWEETAENIEAAWEIANRAVQGTDVQVFADIGPLPGIEPDESEYEKIVRHFLKLGAKNFLFETFSEADAILPLAAMIHSEQADAFVMLSFGCFAEGFTPAGIPIARLLKEADACPGIDAVGVNCVSGPKHLAQVVENLRYRPEVLSVMPNAGYPANLRGKVTYGGKPDFFAECLAGLKSKGVRILGGCCGTTPAFIRSAAEQLANVEFVPMPAGDVVLEQPERTVRNRLSEKLNSGKRVMALELDPPADDAIDFFMDGARRLSDAGVDAITIADCPIARSRADSSILAAKLHRELGIEPIPHMTCRDRNINAIRALLLGLSIEEVHNILLVTGDPIPSAEREQIKGVFSFNSAALASYVQSLVESNSVAPFRVFGALNVNANNFDAELAKALRKEAGGMTAFLTQPVMTDQAFENLRRAHETLHSPILGGIYPLVSHKNACFMNSEVSGVSVPQSIIDRYEGLDREQAEDVAVQLAFELAERMLPYTAGWYLMTPFKRVALMERVIKKLNQLM